MTAEISQGEAEMKMTRIFKVALEQEVCKKKILYTGSNFLVKASRPPLLLYAVSYSHPSGGKFPHLAVRFQIFEFSPNYL